MARLEKIAKHLSEILIRFVLRIVVFIKEEIRKWVAWKKILHSFFEAGNRFLNMGSIEFYRIEPSRR